MEKVKEILKKIWKANKASIVSIVGFAFAAFVCGDPFTWKMFGIISLSWFYGLNTEFLGYQRGKNEKGE